MFFGCVEGKTLRSLLFLLSITFFFLFVVRWAFADGEQQQQQPSQRQLAFVQCVWRHGDRAPGGLPYSGDPYDESYWPRGWSQLTNLGMEQMRELGQFLRKRYVKDLGFLGAKYDKKDVFVQSSESDRALTSAQALLHGMYPALDSGDQFDPQLGWQPIAVHSTGPNNELLKPTSFECPKYNKLKIEVKKQLGLELTKKYGELFEFLRIQVFNSTEPISLHKAAKLNDINREIIHNLSQPDWVHRLWPQYGNLNTLELVTELKRLERINEFKHPELAYLKGGFLLGDWLSRAEQVVKQKSPPEAQKAVLYSAHDGTLQALLYAMGLGDDRLVPYASLVCMELYRVEEEGRSSNNNSRHQMDILYRRSGELLPLKLADCTMENCPVDDAFKLLRKGAIFERQHLFKECGNSEDFCEVPTTREKGD